MMSIRSLSKFAGSGRHRLEILKNLNFELAPGVSAVIYGLPRSGKSTLAAICAGLSQPNSGRIIRYGKLSIPIGAPVAMTFGGTAKEGCYVLSRLYRIKRGRLEDFVEEFSELHGYMDVPLRRLTIEQRVRLIYGIGFGVPADLYLVDGRPYRGQSGFAQKVRAAFEERRRKSPFLCVTGDLDPAVLPGAIGGLLKDGALVVYETAEEAARIFSRVKGEFAVNRMEHARGLLRQGKEEDAVGLLELITEDEPDNTAAFELLSKIAWRGGDFKRVMAFSNALVRLGTADVDTQFLRARAAERNKDWEEAIEAGEAVLRVNNHHRDAAALVGRCYEQTGAFDLAARVWVELADGKPGPELSAGLRCLINAENWPALLDLVESIAPSTQGSDKNIIDLGLRAAVTLDQPQRAVPLLIRLAHHNPKHVFVALTAYRTKLGWLFVARSINQIRLSGCQLAKDGRGYDVVVKFLNQARPAATKTRRDQEILELERALENLALEVGEVAIVGDGTMVPQGDTSTASGAEATREFGPSEKAEKETHGRDKADRHDAIA